MSTVLVSVASRYGGTSEIGERVVKVLTEAGHRVRHVSPRNVTDLAGVDAVVLGGRTAARSHQLFGGRLERPRLRRRERVLVGLLQNPDGDSRDWDAIDRWAGDVARQLHDVPTHQGAA